MRVKSLQITGFKSFVDKTAFSFRPGITGIVGPNGCGKSNVVDAIRWAMGEQSPRRLRGKGMEDIIFAGSEVRSPVGMAEVVLSFDNSAGLAPAEYATFNEIAVSRRLYRSGESEYLINKTPVRLRDVQDFFRDTGIGTKGYTIVEQGRIAEIVSAKAEERRSLIEEAAGISKYKARRREAERKLEATDGNLTRVRDILSEIKRQISSIERQAKKAARYKRLRELQRLLELSLASDERKELTSGLEQAGGRLTGLRDAVTAAEARLSESEADVEAKRLDLVEREKRLGQGNEVLFELRSKIKELEGQIGYERRERASLAENNEARAREKEQLTAQLESALEEAGRAGDELRTVESALSEAGQAKETAEAEAQQAEVLLRGLEQQRETENTGLVNVLTGVARGEDRMAALVDRRDAIDRRLRSADEQLEVQQGEATRADEEQQALEEGLRNLLAERDRLMGLVRDALANHAEALDASRLAAEQLQARHGLRETRRARLESLQEILSRQEDVGQGVRHLLRLGEEDQRGLGLRGLVRDSLDVDAGVEKAVEAVLAERAEALVVENGSRAVQAIDALRRADGGRAVLILQRDADDSTQGFVPLGTPLLGSVQPRPGYEALARTLLGNVNLVERISEAIELYGKGGIPCTFVTRSGDVLTPDGVVRGGGDAAQTGILTRVREVRELEDEVLQLDREVAMLETAGSEAETRAAQASDELENFRNRHHTAALAVANHEKDLERNRERVKAIGEAKEGRVAERSEFLSEVEALEEERTGLEQRLGTDREERSRLQRVLEQLTVQLGSTGREVARLGAIATERRVLHEGREEAASRLREALERAESSVRETRDWIQRRDAEMQTAEERRTELARTTEEAERVLAEQLREEEAARVGNEEKRDAYEQQAALVRSLEEQARSVRIDLESQRDEAQQAELGLREQELRLQHLDESIREKWGIEIVDWKPPAPAVDGGEDVPEVATEAAAPVVETRDLSTFVGPIQPEVDTQEVQEEGLLRSAASEDRDARREAKEIADLMALDNAGRTKELKDIRKRIEAVGEVNLGAIEEHEELRERFRFLGEQKTDLETSVEQLRDAISRINRTSRKRFRETFEAVKEKFEINFPRMFRGGKASLALTESEDVLEAGIDIMAQPPGKRLQSVNLLSGGEKTMTAIALLVSVFQVRPSPFFLLDEVDAALDDANVGRFNEIVKEMAESSQFLLITHNKRTIEIADILYGVTMEEKGVSKLVAVEVH